MKKEGGNSLLVQITGAFFHFCNHYAKEKCCLSLRIVQFPAILSFDASCSGVHLSCQGFRTSWKLERCLMTCNNEKKIKKKHCNR